MKSAYRFSLILIFGFSLLSPAMVGCEDETAIEEVGEDISDGVEDAVDETGDALDDAGDEIEEAVE